jgi:peptide/nickel transport system substrate-binding protein/oligopeptide transport system substrate-binding protein
MYEPKGGCALSERIRKAAVGLLVLALVLTMVGAVGCSTSDTGSGDGDEKMGGTMSFFLANPVAIDPLGLEESEGTQVGAAVFDSLVAFDPITSEIVPAAAESWEPNEDATVWTFNLVDGATFHNGDPVTAADFKYAWERIADIENESPISYHLAPVKGFEDMQKGEATELEGVVAVDDTTLEVTLEAPFADFESVVGHPALAPVPQSAVEDGVDYEGEMVDFALMPIGNGPFMMMEPWQADQYIKVEKNEDYYGEEPYIDGIDFRIFADVDTGFLEFQAGNLDFVDIPTGQIQATAEQYGEATDGYTSQPGEQTLLGEETAIYYYAINTGDETFSDVNVRKALSYAVNRQQIAEKVYEETRVPATGIIPPGVPGFQEDAWPDAAYDPDMAAQLLEEAGYPGGEGFPAFNIDYNTEDPGHEAVATLVKEDFAAIGLEAQLDGTEWGQYLDKLDAGSYQVGRLGWIADYPIQDNFTYPLFHSESGDNYSGYSNPDVDVLLDEARSITDADERAEKYREIEQALGEDLPVIPIVFYRHANVASDRVNDGVYSPKGLFAFERVWLSDADSASE